jgi:hypothetical protein
MVVLLSAVRIPSCSTSLPCLFTVVVIPFCFCAKTASLFVHDPFAFVLKQQVYRILVLLQR